MVRSYEKGTDLKKNRSADKKLKNNKKKQTAPMLSTSNGIKVEIR
jgi:hypothetical protein